MPCCQACFGHLNVLLGRLFSTSTSPALSLPPRPSRLRSAHSWTIASPAASHPFVLLRLLLHLCARSGTVLRKDSAGDKPTSTNRRRYLPSHFVPSKTIRRFHAALTCSQLPCPLPCSSNSTKSKRARLHPSRQRLGPLMAVTCAQSQTRSSPLLSL